MQIAGSKEQRGGRRGVCISRGMPRTLYTTLAGQAFFELWQITKNILVSNLILNLFCTVFGIKTRLCRVSSAYKYWIDLFTLKA